MGIIFAVGILGILLSIVSHGCALSNARQKSDALVLGVPIALIGVVGYILIVASAFLSLQYEWMAAANHLLVAGATLFTFYLIARSIRVRMFCSMCLGVWMTNASLALITLWILVSRHQAIVAWAR